MSGVFKEMEEDSFFDGKSDDSRLVGHGVGIIFCYLIFYGENGCGGLFGVFGVSRGVPRLNIYWMGVIVWFEPLNWMVKRLWKILS